MLRRRWHETDLGRVSRYGLVAFASSLDQIGPLTKDVTDSAIMLNAIAGHDPMDSTSADVPVPDFRSSLVKDVKGMKVGIPKEYFIEGMDPEVDKAVRAAVKVLEGLGATVMDTRSMVSPSYPYVSTSPTSICF
jgi:aspartyl-tRNA(Asn)/glutamyl-tRNA(Gln) amidotransferase subunit A